MGVSENDWKMEGWLYVIRSNRLGLPYSRKRYFVLQDSCLNCFKSAPLSKKEAIDFHATYNSVFANPVMDPKKSVAIDSYMRVSDNGRETINRKAFFIFSLYNASNHDDRLKLGARSSEEAAKWVLSFKEAALKECPNHRLDLVACSKTHSYRLNPEKITSHRSSLDFVDWTVCSSPRSDRAAVDVVSPSPWTIFACQNGLRLFKEAKDGDFDKKPWDEHPATMAVSVVDAPTEAIFQAVMSLGPSRSEWDFCFYQGSVVEHLDGHADIIHKQLTSNWLPWGMKRRDLLLRRYWRREDDGTYVILYHSVYHKKCLPESGTVRALLKSGGYVISPANQGKQSVVKHMLAIDWKFWKSCILSSSARAVTIKMLGRIAALRELFKARFSDFSSNELTKEIGLPQIEDIKVEILSTPETRKSQCFTEEEAQKSPKKPAYLGGSLLQLSDAADEFFDVPEQSDYDQLESAYSSDPENEMHNQAQDLHPAKLSTAAGFVKKLQDLKAQRNGYMGIRDASQEDGMSSSYRTTLPKDPSGNLACSWTTADPSSYLIRGENYLRDNQKVKANDTMMQLVAVDWLKSNKREDDLGGRPGSIVQKHAEQGGNEFFFIINIQVPGSTTHSLALYYMTEAPLESIPLLNSFVKGDDAYRNSRFKLIPFISKGSWIVKQSVGKKACLVGEALEINYFRGKNYLELGVDVGSSAVARGVVNLVLGYLNNLVIEMAFVIQANTQEELPECLIGTCRLNHLDASKSVSIQQ